MPLLSRLPLRFALAFVVGCVGASQQPNTSPSASVSPSTDAAPAPVSSVTDAAPAPPRVRHGTGPAIRTDRPRYLLADSGGIARLTIPFSYRNDTDRPVYLPTCRGVQPPRLEKKVGDRWIVAYAPIVSFCQGVPVSIRPGDSFNYTMRIVAGMPGTSYAPRFIVSEVPGTYRVLWEVFGGVRGDARQPVPVKDLLPLEQRISNEFQLAR